MSSTMMNFKMAQYANVVINVVDLEMMFNNSIQIFGFQTKGALNDGQILHTTPGNYD